MKCKKCDNDLIEVKSNNIILAYVCEKCGTTREATKEEVKEDFEMRVLVEDEKK